MTRLPEEDYSWVRCRGCDGEVGVPADWPDDLIECPKCGERFLISGRLRYRPSLQIKRSEDGMLGSCYAALGLGILSILFGWTFVVPLAGILYYFMARDQARRERVLVPRFAVVGFYLSCGFGLLEMIPLLWLFVRFIVFGRGR